MTSPKENNINILIVDADEQHVQACRAVLENRKWSVFTEASEADALLALQQHTINLILVDIGIVRPHNCQFLRKIRQTFGKDDITLPVIVLSSVESAELETKCYRYGANAWITKPIRSFSELLLHVERLLGIDAAKKVENT